MPLPESIESNYTYADYVKWPEDRRWELVDGRAYDMSPAPSTEHQRLFRRLFVQIANQLEGKKCEVFSAPFDVRLPRADEADGKVSTVVQPDIAVVCDPAKLDRKGCCGAPDWVVEIVSEASASHDLIRKLNIYERHGVAEYWIVQPVYRIVMVYTLNAQGLYSAPKNHDASKRIGSNVLPEIEIDLGLVFGEPAK